MSATLDSPLRVLLVEDNPNDARLIKRHMREADTSFLPDRIEIHHQEQLDPAVETLESEQIDLFLLDLGLPGSTGPETYERVRDRTRDVPVIVLTGLRDERAAVDLLQQGVQDYLTKESLDAQRLATSVRYAVERQQREAELRTKTEQLELLNRILRHDIQNDLQIIQSWTIAAAEEANDGVATRLEKVLETGAHILELTENSQELVELVAGEGDLDHEPVALDSILREVIDKARSKYGTAEFECGPLPAVTVRATTMLSSVFRNLLNNAVQHNDSEIPHVAVSVDSREDVVRVTVADNGPGVPPGEREAVFGKGERGLESEGTGMGLYLVHTLVTEFGGRVDIEDRATCRDSWPWPGDDPTGAAFVVELPRATGVADP